MASNTLLDLQPSPATDRLAGSWKLAPERAVTLNPGQVGLLRVTEGRVWATLEGPHHGPANDWGDIVLRSGQQICLLPGQQVVVEAYPVAANDGAASFSWEPAPEPAVSSAGEEEASLEDRVWWAALRVAGRVHRAVGLLNWLVAGRGRVLSPLESNQP